MSRKHSAEVPESTDPKPVEMTEEQRESLEAEKAQLLASLNAKRPTVTVRIAPVAQPVAQPVEPKVVAAPPPPAPEPPAPYTGPSAAEVRAQMQALEAQLKEALRHETLAKQAQAAVDQRTAAQKAGEELAPIMGKL